MIVILDILEVLVAIVLIALILLQMQGSGLSTAFGGTGEFYRSKRSVEKLLMWGTVVRLRFSGLSQFCFYSP